MMNYPESVWLFRHAESAVPDRFHGAESDIELSALGYRQAESWAAWMRPQQPTRLIHTGMIRARQTLEPLVQQTGIEPQIVPGLIERRVGVIGQKPFDSIRPLWEATTAAWTRGELDYTTTGAESYQEVAHRALSAWQELIQQHPGERLVIVCHGITCRILLLSLLPGYGPSAWPRLGRIPNLAGSCLRWSRAGEIHAEPLLIVPEPVAALNDHRPTGLSLSPAAEAR